MISKEDWPDWGGPVSEQLKRHQEDPLAVFTDKPPTAQTLKKENKKANAPEPNRTPPPIYTKEQQIALGEHAFARKMEASDPNIIVRANCQWRHLTEQWRNWDADERRDVVFGLAYHAGFKARDIARMFRIKPAELNDYKDIMDQGLVALKHKIASNQITYGLMTDQPVVKFHLGKQFAEQVDNPAHDGVDTVESKIPTIVIQETRAQNTELRAELEGAVQAATAIANGGLRAVK